MSESTHAHAEHTASPETLSPSARMDGAQLRFVLNPELLDPSKEIPDTIKSEDITSLDNRNYSVFHNASTFNRIADSKKLVAEHKLSSDSSEQKKQWIQATAKVMNSKDNQSRFQKLSPVLQKLGATDSSEASIKKIYERLFENDSLEKYNADGKNYMSSDIKAFVKAVIDTHTHNGHLSYDSLTNNMAEYKWFAKVFGTEMQEAVVQMIDAEARLKNNKDTFIKETTVKINDKPRAGIVNLKPEEKHILEYVYKNGKATSSHHTVPHDDIHDKVAHNKNDHDEKKLKEDEEKKRKAIESQQNNSALPTELPFDKSLLKRPDLTTDMVNAKTLEILKRSKEERMKDIPVNNAEAATVFADNLRKVIAMKGIQSKPGEINGKTMYGFRNPNNKISIIAPDRKGIAEGWFNGDEFLDLADNYKIPLVYLAQPGQIGLLVKEPFKDSDGEWKFITYDVEEGEKTFSFKPKEDYKDFREKEMANIQQFYNPEKKAYIFPLVKQDEAQDSNQDKAEPLPEEFLEVNLFSKWLSTNGMNIRPNTTAALQNIGKGGYDLTFSPTDGVPESIISYKIGKDLFDKKNSVPIALFAGALRYAAKPGENDFKKSGIKKFKTDFGIDILTREEMIEGQKK